MSCGEGAEVEDVFCRGDGRVVEMIDAGVGGGEGEAAVADPEDIPIEPVGGGGRGRWSGGGGGEGIVCYLGCAFCDFYECGFDAEVPVSVTFEN